jgi:hypothetical protein
MRFNSQILYKNINFFIIDGGKLKVAEVGWLSDVISIQDSLKYQSFQQSSVDAT